MMFKVGDYIEHKEWGTGSVKRIVTDIDSSFVYYSQDGKKSKIDIGWAERNLRVLTPLELALA